jgi:hypothetical protein
MSVTKECTEFAEECFVGTTAQTWSLASLITSAEGTMDDGSKKPTERRSQVCYYCSTLVKDAQLQRHTDPQQPLSCGDECVAKRGPGYNEQEAPGRCGPIDSKPDFSFCTECGARLGSMVGLGHRHGKRFLCDKCYCVVVLA